jgi:transcriptional regulator with XRE-family HTH domain
MEFGVAYPLWQRLEAERVSKGWTKMKLAEESGLPRTTYNDLQKTSRPPLPRIVHAFADALGIDRVEAEQLAGLRPKSIAQVGGVREAIQADETLTPRGKRVLHDLYEELTANDRAARPRE